MTECKKTFRRLPKTIKPVVYDLYMKPDLLNFTFEGKETVSINVSTYYSLSCHNIIVYLILTTFDNLYTYLLYSISTILNFIIDALN